MDGVGQLHPLAVFGLTHPSGKACLVVPIHLDKRTNDPVTHLRILGANRVEQAAPDDFEGLIWRCWLPLRCLAGDDVLEFLQC